MAKKAIDKHHKIRTEILQDIDEFLQNTTDYFLTQKTRKKLEQMKEKYKQMF